MLEHIVTKHPQVYETMMRTSSHTVATKEDRALTLAGKRNEACGVETTSVPLIQPVDASK